MCIICDEGWTALKKAKISCYKCGKLITRKNLGDVFREYEIVCPREWDDDFEAFLESTFGFLCETCADGYNYDDMIPPYPAVVVRHRVNPKKPRKKRHKK